MARRKNVLSVKAVLTRSSRRLEVAIFGGSFLPGGRGVSDTATVLAAGSSTTWLERNIIFALRRSPLLVRKVTSVAAFSVIPGFFFPLPLSNVPAKKDAMP